MSGFKSITHDAAVPFFQKIVEKEYSSQAQWGNSVLFESWLYQWGSDARRAVAAMCQPGSVGST